MRSSLCLLFTVFLFFTSTSHAQPLNIWASFTWTGSSSLLTSPSILCYLENNSVRCQRHLYSKLRDISADWGDLFQSLPSKFKNYADQAQSLAGHPQSHLLCITTPSQEVICQSIDDEKFEIKIPSRQQSILELKVYSEFACALYEDNQATCVNSLGQKVFAKNSITSINFFSGLQLCVTQNKSLFCEDLISKLPAQSKPTEEDLRFSNSASATLNTLAQKYRQEVIQAFQPFYDTFCVLLEGNYVTCVKNDPSNFLNPNFGLTNFKLSNESTVLSFVSTTYKDKEIAFVFLTDSDEKPFLTLNTHNKTVESSQHVLWISNQCYIGTKDRKLICGMRFGKKFGSQPGLSVPQVTAPPFESLVTSLNSLTKLKSRVYRFDSHFISDLELLKSQQAAKLAQQYIEAALASYIDQLNYVLELNSLRDSYSRKQQSFLQGQSTDSLSNLPLREDFVQLAAQILESSLRTAAPVLGKEDQAILTPALRLKELAQVKPLKLTQLQEISQIASTLEPAVLRLSNHSYLSARAPLQRSLVSYLKGL